MNDLDDIRKRMKKRRGTKDKPLNDENFKSFYNFMVKFMVAILVVLVSLSYVKVNPDSSLKQMILNDTNYKVVSSFITDNLLSFLPKEDESVSGSIEYTHINGNYYKNNSNEVLSVESGRVIALGNDDDLGDYVVILGANDVEITYSMINNVTVTLYDDIERGIILGSYQEKLVLQFERLGKEISYEEYQRME